MTKPKLLDLFCGEGGCSMGYHRAGFDVVGVDLKPQSRYPFKFYQCDAIEFVGKHGQEFDLIHASPPCQFHSCLKSVVSVKTKEAYQDLIPETRRALVATRKPYVIENVYGARRSLINPIMLCGTYFGLKVYRHRLFECSPYLMHSPHVPHRDNLKGSGRGLSDKGINDPYWFTLLRSEVVAACDYLEGKTDRPHPRQRSGALLTQLRYLQTVMQAHDSAHHPQPTSVAPKETTTHTQATA